MATFRELKVECPIPNLKVQEEPLSPIYRPGPLTDEDRAEWMQDWHELSPETRQEALKRAVTITSYSPSLEWLIRDAIGAYFDAEVGETNARFFSTLIAGFIPLFSKWEWEDYDKEYVNFSRSAPRYARGALYRSGYNPLREGPYRVPMKMGGQIYLDFRKCLWNAASGTLSEKQRELVYDCCRVCACKFLTPDRDPNERACSKVLGLPYKVEILLLGCPQCGPKFQFRHAFISGGAYPKDRNSLEYATNELIKRGEPWSLGFTEQYARCVVRAAQKKQRQAEEQQQAQQASKQDEKKEEKKQEPPKKAADRYPLRNKRKQAPGFSCDD
jgi:hypothetical protein